MIIANGIEQKQVSGADFSMVSVAPNKIQLPYTGEHWGELYLNTIFCALSNWSDDGSAEIEDSEDVFRYDKIVKSAGMDVIFNVRQGLSYVAGVLHIETTNGKLVEERIQLSADDEEIASVLARFFGNGGLGLAAGLIPYYSNKFEMWKREVEGLSDAEQRKFHISIDKSA